MKEINKLIVVLLFIFSITSCKNTEISGTLPIPAHAHNDYNHATPLFDALTLNFRSIEADVYSIGDSLFVAHDFENIKPGRTLRNLYLNPLKEYIAQNNGFIFSDSTDLILLVDIKDDSLRTYKLLHEILNEYKEMLTVIINGNVSKGSVTVVVSGNRAIDYISNQNARYAGIDGRISDLTHDYPVSLMPLISDNWNNYFEWTGNGEMPSEEREKLHDIVRKTKEKGCMLRFWATPDSEEKQRENVWNELYSADVSLIGTDDLNSLKEYLSK